MFLSRVSQLIFLQYSYVLVNRVIPNPPLSKKQKQNKTKKKRMTANVFFN